MKKEKTYVESALRILRELELPKAQQNERSALCLLALLNMTPGKKWVKAEGQLMGITPIMKWVEENYSKEYAPNTRETFRRQTIHQFIEAGLVVQNPDTDDRAVNSPKNVYCIESEALKLLKTFDSRNWHKCLKLYLSSRETLIERYKQKRDQKKVPIKTCGTRGIVISPGKHSKLIKLIIEEFAERFAPGSDLIYVGDTGAKGGYFNSKMLSDLGVNVDLHGKMPDVILYFGKKKWLLLVEAVTSHGAVDGKRHNELAELFQDAKVGLVFVTAFPNRAVMAKYLKDIAWETEVWVADSPSHLIHFNGERFLGPY